MKKYYCIIYKFIFETRIEVFTSSSQFGLRVGSLYRAFDAESELHTFSLRAESVEDAIQKARNKYYGGECC